MELCPVCRYRDATCKIRMLRGQTFFSCESCYKAEERKHPPQRPDSHDFWGDREPQLEKLPRFLEEALTDQE